MRVCAFVSMFTCAWIHDFTPEISTRSAGDTHLLLPPHQKFPRRGCAGPDSLGDIYSLLSSRPPVPLDVFVRGEEEETLYGPATEEQQRTPPGGSRRRRRMQCRCLGRVVVGTAHLAYDSLGFWRFRSRHSLHLRAFSMWTHSQFWRGHRGGREYRDGEEQARDGWIHDWFHGRGWPAARPALRSWAVDREPRLCFQPTCVPLEFGCLAAGPPRPLLPRRFCFLPPSMCLVPEVVLPIDCPLCINPQQPEDWHTCESWRAGKDLTTTRVLVARGEDISGLTGAGLLASRLRLVSVRSAACMAIPRRAGSQSVPSICLLAWLSVGQSVDRAAYRSHSLTRPILLLLTRVLHLA